MVRQGLTTHGKQCTSVPQKLVASLAGQNTTTKTGMKPNWSVPTKPDSKSSENKTKGRIQENKDPHLGGNTSANKVPQSAAV